MVLAVVAHTVAIQDRAGAKLVLAKVRGKLPRLDRIWADGGYAGALVDWVLLHCGWLLEIVKRTDKLPEFVVLPHR